MFENNNVIVLNINMKFDITDEVFNKKLKDGLMFMIEHNPPYLIHCEAGIDRTGFLSIILGSFMGAEFGDIVKDYMLSFVDNDEYSGADYKNGSLFIINQFNRIKSELKHSNENLQCLSKRYMLEKIKLNINEIQILENKLMNKEK
jgi:protein tyrosine/serine phosphatase